MASPGVNVKKLGVFPAVQNKAGTVPVPMIGFHAVKISNDSNVAKLNVVPTQKWVWLPVPPEGVSTAYPQGWDEDKASAAGSGISQMYAKFFESSGAGPGSTGPPGRNYRGNSNTTDLAGVAGTAIDVGVEKAKSALGAGAGINQRVLEQAFVSYSGPGYRSHTFSFSLKPESKAEAENIDAIVQFFKFYSAPVLGDAAGVARVYDVPHLFQIEVLPSEGLFKFKRCALKTVGVKYGGEKYSIFLARIVAYTLGKLISTNSKLIINYKFVLNEPLKL